MSGATTAEPAAATPTVSTSRRVRLTLTCFFFLLFFSVIFVTLIFLVILDFYDLNPFAHHPGSCAAHHQTYYGALDQTGIQTNITLRFQAGYLLLLCGLIGWVCGAGPLMAQEVVPALGKQMLCLADRFFQSYQLWRKAASTGADLVWRVRRNARLEVDQRLPDGSYLSRIYASTSDRRNRRHGIVVRVIDYRLHNVPGSEPLYRLITTILDPQRAPAQELAALYHERWEIETALDELKTHLRGAQIVLRSKTPALVEQEFWGLLMAHYAIRGLMHEAALKADEDPDRLSFLHSVRVVQRRLARYAAIPPSGQESPA